ncbi:hypothetical protein QYF36_019280 [Acer negundo]|nr:hypothetical protein QYF36_019280 [Acer negundo]
MGYRFQPTDEELVTYFLFNKIFAETDDPFNDVDKFSVREGDLYGSQDPCDIWNLNGGDNLEDGQPLYLFTRLKKVSSNGSRISRRVGSGTWAGEDSGDTIISHNYVVGVKKRFRYENKKSPDNGAWIMHEFAVDPTLLRHHRKPDDIVLCRMKKNPVAEKKKRKLQQVLNSEPWMPSKSSKLVEPQPVPISVQQYQQEAEFNSQHRESSIETESLDARLMYSSLEEEELLNSIDQLLQSDDELMAAEIREISAESSTIDVYHPDTTISVQQQEAEPGCNMVHVLPSKTEPVDTSLMFDPQELFLEEEELLCSIELDQLLESDDESMAAETQEISGPISAQHTGSNIVQVLQSETEPDLDQELLFSLEEEELLCSTSLDQLLGSVH